MKKLWVALTVALLVSVAIGVGAASATHSNGEGPKQDLVSGTSQFEGGGFDAQPHVNATSGPSGKTHEATSSIGNPPREPISSTFRGGLHALMSTVTLLVSQAK